MSSNEKVGAKFSNNMGRKSPWWQALNEWNSSSSQTYCVPKKGSQKYNEVMAIMEKKYKAKKAKTAAEPSVPKKTRKKTVQVSESNVINEPRKRNQRDFIKPNAKLR